MPAGSNNGSLICNGFTETLSGNLTTSGAFNTTLTVTGTTNVTIPTSGTLSAFTTGTFSPALSFGGSSTGITYSVQQGEYTQIGNIVFFNIFIILSSKGSATGSAQISVPIASGGPTTCEMSGGYMTGLTLNVLYTSFGAYITPTDTLISLSQNGSGQTSSSISDTNFSNSTAIGIQGFYFTS